MIWNVIVSSLDNYYNHIKSTYSFWYLHNDVCDLKKVGEEDLDCFKDWEIKLPHESSFYDDPVELDEDTQRQQHIFKYKIDE